MVAQLAARTTGVVPGGAGQEVEVDHHVDTHVGTSGASRIAEPLLGQHDQPVGVAHRTGTRIDRVGRIGRRQRVERLEQRGGGLRIEEPVDATTAHGRGDVQEPARVRSRGVGRGELVVGQLAPLPGDTNQVVGRQAARDLEQGRLVLRVEGFSPPHRRREHLDMRHGDVAHVECLRRLLVAVQQPSRRAQPGGRCPRHRGVRGQPAGRREGALGAPCLARQPHPGERGELGLGAFHRLDPTAQLGAERVVAPGGEVGTLG